MGENSPLSFHMRPTKTRGLLIQWVLEFSLSTQITKRSLPVIADFDARFSIVANQEILQRQYVQFELK